MFEFSYPTIGGLKLRVMRADRGSQKPPLVVCNGLGQSCETIQPFFEQMGDRTLISFDAAGVGHSETPPQFMTMEDHAELLAGVLDAHDVEVVDLMGISWGGALAQQFVRSFTHRCRRLVLAVTSVGGPMSLTGSPMATAEILFPLRRINAFWNRLIGPVVYGGEAVFAPNELAEYAQRNVKSDLSGYYGQIAAMFNWTSLHWLHEISRPTLVYSGIHDPLIPFWNQHLIAARIPNAKLRTLNSGHWLVYAKRKVISKEIADFLS